MATKVDQFLPPISITKFDPANFMATVELRGLPRGNPKSASFEDVVVDRLRVSSYLGVSRQPGVIEHDPK